MKKVLCVLLSICLLFVFTACSKDEETAKKSNIDLEYYANLGKISECDYSLGANVDTLREELSSFAESEDGETTLYDEIEGDEVSYITNGNYKFYYKNDSEDEGINYIVSYGTAYGFEIGEIIINVKEKLSGIEFVEEEIDDENAFFLFAPIEGSVIKCEFEKNTVMFVFENNALCATAVYDNEF